MNRTLADTELDEKYEIKFTSKEANFTITTQKSDINEFIAYSPVVAVFNEDEELYQTYIEDGIFVQEIAVAAYRSSEEGRYIGVSKELKYKIEPEQI